jgi:hypothetical protein
MDDQTRLTRIREFLDHAGLGALKTNVEHSRQREHSTVYSAWLHHDRGDAQIEIFVYDLTEDPAGIVDAEEERIALSELDSDLVPTLLSYQHDDDLVLLAVADAASTARLRSYLEPTKATEDQLSYQPDVDRLIGGDYLQQIEDGRITLSCLMSMRRAEALYAVLRRLATATGANTDNPWVPVVLATYEVEPINDIIASFGDVPAEYAELAMLTTVISRYEPLGSPAMRLDPADAGQLAFRLFSTVHEAHQLSATLSRAGGCSLLPEFVTPTGDLTDAYYLTAGDEFDTTDLAQLQVRDIANAVHLLTQTVAPSDPLLTAVISTGIDVYTGMQVGAPMAELVAAVAERRETQSMLRLATAAHRVASQRGWRPE